LFNSSATLMWIADGITSLLNCPILTCRLSYEVLAINSAILTLGFICCDPWVRRGVHRLTMLEWLVAEEGLARACGNKGRNIAVLFQI
jgi:hypothetical protein